MPQCVVPKGEGVHFLDDTLYWIYDTLYSSSVTLIISILEAPQVVDITWID